MNSILPHTTLCTIVRDEMMNPAGGIVDFVESTAPFVEEAVILDTGSIDGTYETLQDLKSRFPNLKVFQHFFEGYAKSRNRALSHLKTSRALILDADERIVRKDFDKMAKFLRKPNVYEKGYGLKVWNISHEGNPQEAVTHNPRLFKKSYVSGYKDNYDSLWRHEAPRFSQDGHKFIPGGNIWHFIPHSDALHLKSVEWYQEGDALLGSGGAKSLTNFQPSRCSSFAKWKSLNPHRERYR